MQTTLSKKIREVIESELVLVQDRPTKAGQNPRSFGYFAKGSPCHDVCKVKQ
jgi:hypothetical protein